ncbi:MAG: O-antigen ligase family protein [Desulfuromonadaceae bacterium]|nr:O-antigen ligase family protein [Desulfuromonadaceae bacterium]
MTDIYKLEFKNIMYTLRNESKVYIIVLLYLFLEYFRPQSLYPTIDILPYGKIVISMGLIGYALQKIKNNVRNSANILMVMFLTVILMSSFFGISLNLSMSYWSDIIAWMLIYYLITNVVNTEKRYVIFMLLFLLCSFKMAQFSTRGWITGGRGYSTWGFGGGPGWFHNSGEFGIQMCVYFPLAFYFYMALKEYWPKWKRMAFTLFPLTGLMGMITSSNRGTLVGGAAVIIWMFFKSRYRVKALCALLLVGTLAFKLIPEEQITRFQQAGEDKTSVERLDNWKKGLKMAEMYPVLGVGYKNWQIADRQFFDGNGLLSHNIFVECLSELGYAGLTVFILLIFSTFTSNSQTRRIALTSSLNENKFIYYMAHGLDAALVGYLVSGFFVTVLFYPYFWINLSMTVALNNIAKSRRVSHATT